MFLSGRVFNGSGKPVDKGPAVCAEDYLDIQGGRMSSGTLQSRFICVLENIEVLQFKLATTKPLTFSHNP